MRVVKRARKALIRDDSDTAFELVGDAWDEAALDRLRRAVGDAIGPAWVVCGPVVVREGCALVKFWPDMDLVLEQGQPSERPLVGALEGLEGFDDVEAVRLHGVRELDRRGLARGCVELRCFPKGDAEQADAARHAWLDTAFEALAEGHGEPAAVTVERVGCATDRWDRARDAVVAVGLSASPGVFGWWLPEDGSVVGAGLNAYGALVVTVGGGVLNDGPAGVPEQLRGLGVALAGEAEPAYARVALLRTFRGVPDVASDSQPGSWQSEQRMSMSGAEGRLDTSVPDAYWWQLVDAGLLEAASLTTGTVDAVGTMRSVTFGEAEAWWPSGPWRWDPDYSEGMPEPIEPALVQAREQLRSIIGDRP